MKALDHQTQLTTSRVNTFANQLEKIGHIPAADMFRALSGEMAEARRQFKEGEIDGEAFRAKMEQIQRRVAALISQFEDFKGIDIRGVTSQVTTLGNAIAIATSFAKQLSAALPGGTPGHTTGTPLSGDDLLPPSLLAPATSLRPQLPGVDFGQDADAGGGSRGTDPNELLREQMATRLQTLMEGLMTERETVANWYAEGQALLEEARANELLTESEYFDQKTRLQEEYNRRSQSLMNEEVQMRKSTFSSMIGLLTQFGSKNKALAKVAVALNAAQRVSEISANTAAASTRALAELGPIAGPPVAARIAAYGAMQKAIAVASAAMSAKGISSGSGGSGSISGAASSAQTSAETQAAPQATQTLNFSVTSDPFGISDRLVRQIVGAINQSQRDGSTLIRATVS
jgi:hypothetical protein